MTGNCTTLTTLKTNTQLFYLNIITPLLLLNLYHILILSPLSLLLLPMTFQKLSLCLLIFSLTWPIHVHTRNELIYKYFLSKDTTMLLCAYTTYVGLLHEHVTCIWSPQYITAVKVCTSAFHQSDCPVFAI